MVSRAPRALAAPAALALAVEAAVAGTALAALALAPWFTLAPNRLLPGAPIGGMNALGIFPGAAMTLSLMAAVATTHSRAGLAGAATVLVLSCALLGQLAATGHAANSLLVDQPPAARVMLGAGFWTFAGALLVLIWQAAMRFGVMARLAVVLALATGVAALARSGSFDALSLAVEYRARADQLQTALTRHVWLSLAALACALVVTAPLAWLAFRSPRAEAAIGGAVTGVQVMPAIALFGLLVPLLSLLLHAVPALRVAGLQAIGPAPALIGLAAYLALPLLNATIAGLRAADPAVVEAAYAMGMSGARVTWEVRVPLGLPILSAGLRIAAIQSIGLTVLAALVGAGGLGAVIFEGMAQFAADLILLGAVPVIGLALLTDLLLRAVEAYVSRARR